MNKILALILVVAILAGCAWTYNADGADGSWLGILVPSLLLILLLAITKVRTGEWLSDSSGGH